MIFLRGLNQYLCICKDCGKRLEPGSGHIFMYRGSWHIDHSDCTGVRRWKLERDGWIYACVGVGPNADLIKVGMTSKNPTLRMDDGVIANYMTFPLKTSVVSVWAAATNDRRDAEKEVHTALSAYKANPSLNLGREVFSVTLRKVLDVLFQVTGNSPELFPWRFAGHTFDYVAPELLGL